MKLSKGFPREFVATSTVAGIFDTSTTGVKLTITPAAGKKARLVALVHGSGSAQIKITRDGDVFCTENVIDPGTAGGLVFGSSFMIGSNSGGLTSSPANMAKTVQACIPHVECSTEIVLEVMSAGAGVAAYRILYGE